ncbi:hypothetical protein Val02_66460 [Virgisporangium aliadipatigenens]|uniref:Uncharacterized protein n=1 Tax=Virgisporangium aliadipatigenens TaxID=741659 RepID=A0A8J3YTT7_9ACTN|nr:hypothetical protein [Virgisporangium aliadipatigenens]GIJ49760.1 hypothetical protein Val02_66460 [Virgisporangium aliadipatigenens]
MSATVAQFTYESVRDAVRAHEHNFTTPTLIVLTAGNPVAVSRSAAWDDHVTADAMATTLAGVATLITRHRALFGPAVIAYGVDLPGERVAFVVDRDRCRHHIQLPGVPTQPLRRDRWDAAIDGLTTMINAL